MEKTLYYGGPILTLEREGTVEALLTQGDKILALGDLSQVKILCDRHTREIDLKGKALLPAFLDAHGHFTSYASTLAFADLSETTSLDEIGRRLLDFYKENPDSDFLIGFGYDQNLLPGGKHPDKAFLDALGLPCPILIAHQSGHMGVTDSKGLASMHLTVDSPDPEGGKIGKDENGLTGYLEEAAFMSLGMKMAPATGEKLQRLLQKAAEVYLSFGVTLVQEGLVGKTQFRQMQTAAYPLPVYAYLDAREFDILPESNQKNLHIAGYKIILDGSPQGRTAWMREPYEGTDFCGYPALSDAEVTAYFARALTQGVQILGHANGDAAAEQYVRCFAQAKAETGVTKDIRPVLIHGQLLPLELLPKIKELGIIPSFFVAHIHRWGDTHIKNFGERAQVISPAGGAQKLGIPYTFHADTPVLLPDMLYAIRCAVERTTAEGRVLGESERITRLQALRAVTIHAAHQYFLEQSRGSLKVGKQADFVVLTADPLTADWADIQVAATIFGGKVAKMPED